MAFDWRNFFLHANQLRGSSDETVQRVAIGRAYYYAYHAALRSAKRRGYNPSANASGGVHQRLWEWYANRSNRDDRYLADFGITLKGRRTEADYYLFPRSAITSTTVQKQLDETRDFEVLLSHIDKTPLPPAV